MTKVNLVALEHLKACNVFEPWTDTKTEHFTGQDIKFSQIFKVIATTSEKILKHYKCGSAKTS